MSKQMGELTQKKSKKSKSPPTKKNNQAKKEKPAASAPSVGKDKKRRRAAPRSKRRSLCHFRREAIHLQRNCYAAREANARGVEDHPAEVPSLANSDQNEIELDIEKVPTMHFSSCSICQEIRRSAPR